MVIVWILQFLQKKKMYEIYEVGQQKTERSTGSSA